MVPLQDQCKEIKAFTVQWNNIQKPEECNGQKLIKVKTVNISQLDYEFDISMMSRAEPSIFNS